MKYRIIQVNDNGIIYYLISKRILFFFWTILSYEFAGRQWHYYYNTLEEAKEELNSLLNQKPVKYTTACTTK